MDARRVRLDPMTDGEFQAFAEAHVEEYARQKARAGAWAPHEAVARSRSELSWMLRGDRGGHRFLVVRAADGGEPVGDAWVGPPPDPAEAPGALWLYQVSIRPERRGMGWGRATMEAVHRLAAAEGHGAVWLNAFRWNAPAVALYRSLGYEEVEGDARSARMRRRLAP